MINSKFIFQNFSKKYIRSDSFLTSGYSSNISENFINSFQNYTQKLISILNVNNSFFSFDVLYYKDKFYFIDFGLLLDAQMDRYLFHKNINCFELFLKTLKNENFKINSSKNNIIMGFIYPKIKGIMKNIPLISEKNLNNLYLEPIKSTNEFCDKKMDISDCVGILFSKDHSWKELENIISDMENQIKFSN